MSLWLNANLLCLNLSCPQFLLSLFTHRILNGEIKGLSNFEICGWNPIVWPFKWKLQYFPVVLFIMLYKVVPTHLLSLCMKSYGVTIQIKATEQYFPVVLFIMLYKVVLTFKSVGEILWCFHLNETFFAWLNHSTLYFFGFYQNEF